MKFIVTAHDGENMLEKRMAVRPRHLEGLSKLMEHIVVAGGILDEEGKPKGSVLVMDFEDRTGLDAYLASEPYIMEHVWETVDVQPMNVVILSGQKVGK